MADAGSMGKLHWSFGAVWISFGATQQQPVMGNSQLVDGSLDQLDTPLLSLRLWTQ
ncbi:hypothetical protein HaLaN_04597 [Haematococcus lacustris]|uniref:Uncharacterized protein n=1 Tax=Haematococcus lacustris TaxID=44745 RepID=A0A699YRP4_HAELA|nr:hypothetical protein HaLaN_04597 [Haematococcus lacustris]